VGVELERAALERVVAIGGGGADVLAIAHRQRGTLARLGGPRAFAADRAALGADQVRVRRARQERLEIAEARLRGGRRKRALRCAKPDGGLDEDADSAGGDREVAHAVAPSSPGAAGAWFVAQFF